jgi:cell division protease FtsH
VGSSRWAKNLIYLLIIVAVVAIVWSVFLNNGGPEEKTISTVVADMKTGSVAEILVSGDNLDVTKKGGEEYTARMEEGISIYEILAANNVDPAGVDIQVKGAGGFGNIFGYVLPFLPIILLGAFFLFMMRQAQGGGNQTMNFGRSRARLFVGTRSTVTFDDVAGVVEAKTELQEVVEFLRFPERFLSLGARIPKGVLLVGPPGSGKTLMARAVAGEAGVPFFSISGSEFVEMFVGVGAARVRDLFDQAKRNAPCIVFVDEIDAVGRHRGAGLGGGHDEREQTLNQILVEMDGFDTNTNIIVVAATNRPDILDPALLRPGRFDRRVVLDLPDIKGREEILAVHVKGKPLSPETDMEVVAKETAGFSGADLANLVNEAAILTARADKKLISLGEFEEAVDRVVAGPERRSRTITPKEKKITAYHEAGHALAANFLPNADPVHKVSIVARGMMGGYTRMLPAEDRHLWTRSQFEDMLAVALAGRVAEEIVFEDVTTGASNDLETATKLAREMVTRYGMAITSAYEEMPISTLVERAQNGKIDAVDVYGDDLLVTTKAGKIFRSKKEHDVSLIEMLEQAEVKTGPKGVNVQVKSANGLGGLSLRVYGKRQEMVFLGKEITEERDYSDKIAEVIDNHVDTLIRRAHAQATDVLATNKDKLERLAEYLIQHETVEEKVMGMLMSDEPIPEPEKVVEKPKDEEKEPAQDAKPQPAPPTIPPTSFKPKPAPEA